MKKIKFEGKLNLNKETVTRLNNEHMNSIKGGRRKLSWFKKCYAQPGDKSDTCGLTNGSTCNCEVKSPYDKRMA